MPVTLNDLIADRRRFQTEITADSLLDFRINVLIRADCAGNFTDFNIVLWQIQTLDLACHFFTVDQQFQAKSDWFGMTP
jgi:hypothetical protein